MVTSENFSSAAAVDIPDLAVEESETGVVVSVPPPSGVISARDPPGRGSSAGPTTSQPRVGRRKRSGGLRPDGGSKTSPKSIPMIAPTQTPTSPSLPPLKTGEYNPRTASDRIRDASEKKPRMEWDPELVRGAVTNYAQHLRYVLIRLQQQEAEAETATAASASESSEEGAASRPSPSQPSSFALRVDPNPSLVPHTERLVSSEVVRFALKAMLRMNIDTIELGREVRDMERLIGSVGLTALTHPLSFQLLETNAKSGNVGRTLSLLNLRKARDYPPSEIEFFFAVNSIESALMSQRVGRNVFLSDSDQPRLDNPTRWLDAILINMSERGFDVTNNIANRMLACYSLGGRTGRALHFFYKIVQTKLPDPADPEGQRLITVPRIMMNSRRPRYHKIPSEIAQSSVGKMRRPRRGTDRGDSSTPLRTKLEWESDPGWSPPLEAAFAFSESLVHGACGHPPLTLDLVGYNTLVRACAYRGALTRMLHVMNEIMPSAGLRPDAFTYGTALAALARVGDVRTSRDLLTEMTNRGVDPDPRIVRHLVDGLLNVGDVPGAVTVVQDVFNQHGVPPPYDVHLKVLEFALGLDLPFEARRHLYFLMQLRGSEPPGGGG